MTVEPGFIGQITLDGPSGTGKSSVAREVARKLGASYLDTGAMYRAATVAVLDAGVSLDDKIAVARAVSQAAIRVGTNARRELVSTVMERNQLQHDDVISILFTATPDLVSEFPALAARELGFGDVPLMCATEIDVAHALPRVLRLMAHVETDRPRAEVQHVYLRGAVALRRDIAQ